MNDAPPSLQQLNRTLIGSVLFIDIVGYSQRTVPEQIEMKEFFNDMLAEAVRNVAASERIMVDTGDGAGIAFLGDPEDALFVALSLRDMIVAINADQAAIGEPGFVRMGINLGPLKVVRDINDHTNMIGDAVNDAQRVMSFAEPGQVMVSHSYYDIISRFSRDYTKLFVYEGTRHDKHVREHEVYRFGPVEGTESLAEKLRDRSRARHHVGSIAVAPAPAPAATSQANKTAAPPMQKKTASRAGLIATLIGAIAIVGAVWSWTSKPEMKPDTTPASATASASSPAAKPATDKSALAPSASAAKRQKAEKVEKPAEKSEKVADNATPVAKPGTVKLAIQPWGEVYVDGNKRGVSPPLKSLSLAPGKHRVEIRNSQFAPYKQTIDIKSDVETTVQYAF